jgi:hypothetical protein
LGTYGHFNVPQQTKNGNKIRETSYFTITAPIPFARYNPYNFWLFGTLNAVVKDRDFNPSDEIEEAITKVWNELTFDELQSVFHSGMNRLAWIIENGGECVTE